MDIPDSKLVKSKSSDGTLTKTNQKNKKSKSNAVLNTLMPKKRGVYVERKSTKLTFNSSTVNDATQKEPMKPPRRPIRGQKRFLSSVLNILSKSSTGTQFPDPDNKTTMKKKTNKTTDRKTVNILKKNEVKPTVDTEKKKYKFKSKVLNNNREDRFEVLQFRKEIVHTPSPINSELNLSDENFANIKWSDFLPRLVKPDEDEIQLEKEKKLSHLVREVTEGRMVTDKTVRLDVSDEPPTLVSEGKKDPGLYNFFVDLLETTFSVYNVKAHHDASYDITSVASSKIAFEIDEKVANKLNVGAEHNETLTQERSKQRDAQNDDHIWKVTPDYFQFEVSPKTRRSKQDRPSRTAKKKQMKSDIIFPKYKNPARYSQSVVNSKRKSFYKNNNKNILLSMLKEELKMDFKPFEFEPPQNLYQALKVIAKTKRKSQKTIRFDSSARIADECKQECTFKRRKVISPKRFAKFKREDDNIRNSRSMSPKTSNFGSSNRYLTRSMSPKSSNYGYVKSNTRPTSPEASNYSYFKSDARPMSPKPSNYGYGKSNTCSMTPKSSNFGYGKSNTRPMSPKTSNYGYGRRKNANPEFMTDDEASNHSLEVLNIDYVNSKRKTGRKRKELLMTYRPPETESEEDYKTYDMVMQQVIRTVEAMCQPKKDGLQNYNNYS